MRRTGIVAFVLLCSFAVGCGASTGPGVASGADGETLADFVPGWPSSDAAAADQGQAERAQEAIRDCMAAAGFEYVVDVPDDPFGAQTEADLAAEYGFGLAVPIVDQWQSDGGAPQSDDPDPNAPIVEALSDAERDAYYLALYGEDLVVDDTMTQEEIDQAYQKSQKAGCEASAYGYAYNQEASAAFYEQFGTAYNDIVVRMQSDSRIAALDGQWSACMAEEGYDFATEIDAQEYILSKLEGVGAISDYEVDRDSLSVASDVVELDSATQAAVQDIADEEVEIAVASVGCRQNFETVVTEVYRDYEAQFIEEHRAELEQFRDEYS
jgi:hypothetical protein